MEDPIIKKPTPGTIEKPNIKKAAPGTIDKPKIPTIQKPTPSPLPGKPLIFSNTYDAEEIAKLPHTTSELTYDRSSGDKLAHNAMKWFDGAPKPTPGNVVVPYIYGRSAFEDIADALSCATSPEHRIYLIGWWVLPDTAMKNPVNGNPPANSQLKDYLKNTKAQVRGLFWDTFLKGQSGDNKEITNYINSLPNGAALEDNRLVAGKLPDRGPNIHHQKLLVVSGDAGLVAFLGGMDINYSRLGDSPLHDVHVRLNGPSAAAALSNFRDRWLDHPATAALDQNRFQLSRDAVKQDFDRIISNRKSDVKPSCTVPGGKVNVDRRMLVSIGRTFPNLNKFNSGDRYQFPNPDQSAWQLIKNGIENAKEYIYVEDQYLVSRRVRDLLVKKLREEQFKFLLILMNNSIDFEAGSPPEFPFLIGTRNEIRTDLSAVDPKRQKWRMFSLKNPPDSARKGWCGSYVHSKTWIFDDEYVVVGSANCDDRGYSYDTEIVAGITEEPISRVLGGRFARDLRISLWRKHLGIPHVYLQKFSTGLAYWQNPPPSAMIFDNSDLEDSPLFNGAKELTRDNKNANYVWTHLSDPDADKL
ncbi:phospholipase D family protein [Paenibacillus aceris]|uniref:Phosphatidylserine/phosphatidylglycerophosphate/ cardiolipin synthase-like enzyme n=1 Tax=Paenibacillus aceris TaxID=869555 RepID=A0ABS4IA76_9BACL|nr:phospholipase D-like domain-containing protein [Paenibacillus aceris]MBP1967770.1 phosphatidylserine/phosphatidylglycerophosphate/cardiolipin synthase-like enzyme [Paenibacillus aceris]NHW38196.1 hypothetical protein [Paenibacillus aceris]